jgi:hypothetical protein
MKILFLKEQTRKIQGSISQKEKLNMRERNQQSSKKKKEERLNRSNNNNNKCFKKKKNLWKSFSLVQKKTEKENKQKKILTQQIS